MAAPFPPALRDDTTDFTHLAGEVYRNYYWMARWSDEIDTDANIDLKKLAQLAFKHCVLFADLYATPPLELRGAVFRRMEQEGIEWPGRPAMHTDLVAMRTEALALTAYVDVNVPEALEWEKRTYVKNGAVWKEVPVSFTMAKPHAVTAEVAKLRALFT